ncbi:ArsR/SmtB family transcription factor [Nocardia lijiangensis]|uniref:ArsR/SmtB family transcription factor n=1 Tax=Nocardia lijiangensis TaxID=299618 RepID=UPI0008326AEE|nr:metalloregulator ArsR/SmtB family transcription factor [Nocardia lijiangensis]
MSKSQLAITPVQECAPSPVLRPPLSAESAVPLAAAFKALSDPVRLRVLSAVASRADHEACVCDLSEGIDVTQPTISHHLKVLREAGLLSSERRASWVYYRVEPAVLEQVSAFLAAMTPEDAR